MTTKLVSICVLFTALAIVSLSEASTVEYAVITNGVTVGRMQVTRTAERIDVSYRVDENGRGPKLDERIELAADELPRHWSIRGQSESGTAVEESFRWQEGVARWRTLIDQGNARVSQPGIYLPSDTSPYTFAVYLAALASAPNMTLPAWPAGEIRAERIREFSLGGDGERLTAWALWGLELHPVLIATDARKEFVAWLDPTRLVIAADHADRASELQTLGDSLNATMLRDLMKRVARRPQGPIHLRNVHVLNAASGTLSKLTTMMVAPGRVTEVSSHRAVAETALVIDGEGGTLMPGLFDMHGHLEPWQGPLYLAAGVTTVRDVGNDNAALAKLIDQYQSGSLIGPRVIRAGFLEGHSEYSAQGGFVVDDLATALEKVRWYAEHNYWGVKIYNSVRPEWVAPIAQEAHRLGLRVLGHVPAFMSSREAIRAGYDEVTHLNQLLLSLVIDPRRDDTRTLFRFSALGERTGALDLSSLQARELFTEMRSRNVALDPTVAILSHMMLSRPGVATPAIAPWLEHLPAPLQRRHKSAFLDVPAGQDANYRRAEARLLQAIKQLHDSGVRLLPGTDYSPGFMLASELEAWRRAGLANTDILRLATLECARYLGLDPAPGAIEAGGVLLVDGDPTRDIGVLRKVRLVIKDGVLMFPADIHSAMGVKPFASRPPIEQDPAAVLEAR